MVAAPSGGPVAVAGGATVVVPTPTTCTLVGTWTGTFPAGPQPWAGHSYTAKYGADGLLSAESPMGHKVTSYSFDPSGVLTYSNSQDTGRGACTPSDIGHYALTFSADCASFTATIQDEQCVGRRKGMDGVAFKRN